MVWIPPGFAHGFYVTTEVAEVQYKCSDYYVATYERCIQWDDPQLAIEWPLHGHPLLSDRDRHHGKPLAQAECFP
jgi:dTDP-4-dehydrorhamnose 3,5-epimerase